MDLCFDDYKIDSEICQWDNKAQESILLLNYYYATISTTGCDGYYELVVSSTDDKEKVLLDKYTKDSEDSPEEKNSCLIPYEAVDKVMEYVKSQDIHNWNKSVSVPVDGVKIVFKFWNGKEHIRISSDSMPENGISILNNIGNIIESYIKED